MNTYKVHKSIKVLMALCVQSITYTMYKIKT